MILLFVENTKRERRVVSHIAESKQLVTSVAFEHVCDQSSVWTLHVRC